MGDDDEFVLVLPVTPVAYRELDKEIDKGGTFADHRFHLDEEYVCLPFWDREDSWGRNPKTFWETWLLDDTVNIAKQMQERFSLPDLMTFGVMQGEIVGMNIRYALGAAYPRPTGGGGFALPGLRERGLLVERLPPLIFAGEEQGVDYAYKLIGRFQDFLLFVGLRDQKDNMVLFRAIQNGTPFARFKEMAQKLEASIEAVARAVTGGYDSRKARGVFWTENYFERDLPPILADNTLT